MRGEEICWGDESANDIISAICEEACAIRRPRKTLDFEITSE